MDVRFEPGFVLMFAQAQYTPFTCTYIFTKMQPSLYLFLAFFLLAIETYVYFADLLLLFSFFGLIEFFADVFLDCFILYVPPSYAS